VVLICVYVYSEVGFFISNYHGYFVHFELPSNAVVLGEFQVIGFSCMQRKRLHFL